MKEIPTNVSESVRRLNPHLYSDRGVLGAMETRKPKPALSEALVVGHTKQKRRQGGVVEVVVTLLAHRKRLLDDDNNVGSLKPLRDSVAESVGIDDGDSRIRFQYGQIQTAGLEGVVVTVERL